MHIVMSPIEVPYLIEAPPDGSANSYKIVGPHKIEAPGASNKNLTESIHSSSTTYVAQDHNGSHDNLFYWCGLP